MTESTQILIIDDNYAITDPLVVILKEKYGEERVIVKNSSTEGLKYILNNLSSKLIVLLDLNLGAGEPRGIEVLTAIRKETSLVYVIIMTAELVSEIRQEDFVDFVNNHALAFITNTADYRNIIALVDKAAYRLDTRVDCILEQWISKRPKGEREKPYLTTVSGETYSLDDLIVEIRRETEVGKRLEQGIIRLAIDLLTKGEEKLSD